MSPRSVVFLSVHWQGDLVIYVILKWNAALIVCWLLSTAAGMFLVSLFIHLKRELCVSCHRKTSEFSLSSHVELCAFSGWTEGWSLIWIWIFTKLIPNGFACACPVPIATHFMSKTFDLMMALDKKSGSHYNPSWRGHYHFEIISHHAPGGN